MILSVARCPYRISLLGGGSDLDWFTELGNQGSCLGFSIQEYSHVCTKFSEEKKGILNYSNRETYESIETISHPLIREALLEFNINKFIELSSFGSHRLGGGMGGSSSFLNALLASLMKLNKIKVEKTNVAEISCKIEIEKLNKKVGRQDQYLTSLGGINFLNFSPRGHVSKKIEFTKNIHTKFSKYIDGMVLVKSFKNRSASKVLESIQENNSSCSKFIAIRDKAETFERSLRNSDSFDSNLLDQLIKESWLIKKSLFGVINDPLRELEEYLLSLNLKWIKLLGAGGGGNFLCMPQNKKEFIKNLDDNGKLKFSSVNIDFEGLKVWEV